MLCVLCVVCAECVVFVFLCVLCVVCCVLCHGDFPGLPETDSMKVLPWELSGLKSKAT